MSAPGFPAVPHLDGEPGPDLGLYRTLFESMDQGYCVIEFFDGPHGPLSDYIHILANEAYERNTGIPNVVGQKLREMVGDEADAWVSFYGKVLRTGEPIRFRNELVKTARTLEVSSFRIGPFEDRRVAVLFKDVTDQVRAEDALRQLNETLEARVTQALAAREQAEAALRQAQKMEAVGQLTGGLAHDFNNLLAGISGSFEMIDRRLKQGRSADIDRYLSAGLGAAQRAAALTHRLLAFSRRQTLSPRSLRINTLLPEFADLVRRTVGPSVAVQLHLADDLWPTLVDANQLENALLNLCINARDAMPSGGTIAIATLNLPLDEEQALARGLDAGDYVAITVSDTGVGIPQDDLERVFEPFFTTKPLGSGTGLGLSMVYGFAKQSHGIVRIRSTVGQGTDVRIYLPRNHVAEEAVTSERLPPEMQPNRGGIALIVDDEPSVRMLLADALDAMGYHCQCAADGPEALALLENGSEPDLLVTDVGLPGGLNGRQVADAARRMRPGLRTLFVTGYAETSVLGNGGIEPGMAVLTKPFSLDQLHVAVASLMPADEETAAV
ncbi:ATP-binding protein [Novosphingobium cyanobacteriorum]|uniref:histidine kinase n=1 Tax=Novosphingobium cyanobacteriorum TaxID=3024215 RepID=A0ABT6CG51_9SPHN|nr:ATP-binding protein [Novosphingobium cyanobacteriorum]MDF8332904.1 ATP-binding protein [Novosphingobium cyanobacteriorum]